jgi:hypothetical protein
MAGLGAGSHIQVRRLVQREQGHYGRARAAPRRQAAAGSVSITELETKKKENTTPAVSSQLAKARHVSSAGGNPKSAQ